MASARDSSNKGHKGAEEYVDAPNRENMKSLQPPLREHGHTAGGKHHEVGSYVGNWAESVQMLEVVNYVKEHSRVSKVPASSVTNIEGAIKAARNSDFGDKERKKMHSEWDLFVVQSSVQNLLREAGERFRDLVIDNDKHDDSTVLDTEREEKHGRLDRMADKANEGLGAAVGAGRNAMHAISKPFTGMGHHHHHSGKEQSVN